MALVLTASFGIASLYTKPVPDETVFPDRAAIGLAVADAKGGFGQGFNVDVIMRARPRLTSCNPVEVLVGIHATPEFWRRNPRLPRDAEVAVAMDGENVRGVRIWSPDSAEAAVLPFFEELEARARAQAEGNAPKPRPLDRVAFGPPREHGLATVVTGRISNWARSWTPLLLHFEADWAELRGIGSCYVHVPELVLSSAESAASVVLEDRSGRAIGVGGMTTRGHVRLAVSGGSLSVSSSTPRPRMENDEHVWPCVDPVLSKRHRQRETRSPSGRVTAYPAARKRSDRLQCGAITVATASNERTLRAAAVFLLGALVALAMQMLYDGLLEWRNRGYRLLWLFGRGLALAACFALTAWAGHRLATTYLDTLPRYASVSAAFATGGLLAGLVTGRRWSLLLPVVASAAAFLLRGAGDPGPLGLDLRPPSGLALRGLALQTAGACLTAELGVRYRRLVVRAGGPPLGPRRRGMSA